MVEVPLLPICLHGIVLNYMMGVWKVMRIVTLLIFSGLDQDGACTMLPPQVCLATSAKAVIFHSMCLYELRYETCLEWQSWTIFHVLSFLCEPWKKWWREGRDVRKCVWNRSKELSYSFSMMEAFQRWKRNGGLWHSMWETEHCWHRCKHWSTWATAEAGQECLPYRYT
jgi:hypothetical protein